MFSVDCARLPRPRRSLDDPSPRRASRKRATPRLEAANRWLLLSGKPFGVLLEDDAAPPADFESTLEPLLAAMPQASKYAAYRLGQYTTGMLYPREAAARWRPRG